jgi:hypothetical protein
MQFNKSSRAAVPNLWYAYHWWYAERPQVVRRKKKELLFVSRKLAFIVENIVFQQKLLALPYTWEGYNLLEILGVIGVYSLPNH